MYKFFLVFVLILFFVLFNSSANILRILIPGYLFYIANLHTISTYSSIILKDGTKCDSKVITTFFKSGLIESEETYDIHNNLLDCAKLVFYRTSIEKKTNLTDTYYCFDNSKNLIEIFNGIYRSNFFYTENGYLYKEISQNGDKSIIIYYFYKDDILLNAIAVDYNKPCQKEYEVVYYYNDSKTNIIKSITYYPDNIAVSNSFYYYNSDNLLSKQEILFLNNIEISKETVQFEYTFY